jgi:transcriptional regulator with GAF, ATPase, and Fis domain
VIPVDVRIIAATHKDLADEVRLGNFRSDLFFRLNVFPIEVPPLRRRTGDVELLLRAVLEQLSNRLNRALGIEPEALAALEAYAWPGNVREMENVIERAVYVSERGVLALRDLPEAIRYGQRSELAGHGGPAAQFGGLGATPGVVPGVVPGAASASAPPGGLRRESETAAALHIQRVLASCGGNMTEAARLLGVSRTTLWRKRQRYQL